jgi:hypothetical protein
MIQLQEQ